MTDEDEKTSRTAMLWPVDLKERVRLKVGARGLTAFTLEAVEAKLTGHDASTEELLRLSHELRYAREYSQRAADSLACAGELESRQERLQELGVPEWMDTAGWPTWAVALKSSEGDTPLDNVVTEEAPEQAEPAGQEPAISAEEVDTPADTHPAHDADVEEWRAYARAQGHTDNVDRANRSQIRTMLGIQQPVKPAPTEAEVASFVALAESRPPEPTVAKVAKEATPSKMRTCDGCGAEYDVFVDGEFEKHLAHKQSARPEPEPEPEPEEEVATHDERGHPISVVVLEKQAAERAARGPKADLFDRLQSDAKGLGLDLKPASEVLRPEGQERAYEDDIPSEVPSDLGLAPDEPSPVEEPIEERPAIAVCPNHPQNEVPCPECCPKCGSALISGECWECM